VAETETESETETETETETGTVTVTVTGFAWTRRSSRTPDPGFRRPVSGSVHFSYLYGWTLVHAVIFGMPHG